MKVLFGNKDLVIWVEAPNIPQANANSDWGDYRRYRFKQDNSQFIDIGEQSISYNDTSGHTVKYIYGYKPKLQLNLVCYNGFDSENFNENIINFLAAYLNNVTDGRWVQFRLTPDIAWGETYSFKSYLENIKVYNIADNTKLVGQRLTATATSKYLLSKDEFNKIFYEDTSNNTITYVPSEDGIAIS